MLKPGKQISVYKIKEILSEEEAHLCCLTDDPFFHSVVLLKLYRIDFLTDEQQRKEFAAQLEKLLLLEHPSIAPIFDSGFEGEYFYYTTNYNYQESLLDRSATNLSMEEILKIVRGLGSALESAADSGLWHGNLQFADIYFGDDAQVVIADFGIDHCCKCFMEKPAPEWSEAEALEDLGRLLLQLLRPSDTDNRGRELELLSGIENENLKTLTERFFSKKEDRYRSFSELHDALDSTIESPPPETRPMVQQKSLQAASDNGITQQQREQVLPHVRQLIAEKNHYKTLLDEALLGQNKMASQLTQTRLEIEQLNQLQLQAPDGYVPINRRKIATWVLGGFLLGVILSGSYGYTLQRKNLNSAIPENRVEKRLATAPTVIAEQNVTPVEIEKPTLNLAPVVDNELSDGGSLPDSGVKEAEELISRQVKHKQGAIPVIAAAPQQQWWPAGGEFSAVKTELPPKASVTTPTADKTVVANLSSGEQEEIFQQILSWRESWSKQQTAEYFTHYSKQYRPELGRSRNEWLKMRKSRLQRPEWIKVEIQNVSMRRQGENQVQVKFQQNYHSNSYHDQIIKSLNLGREKGGWKIVTERSLGRVDLVASNK